MYILCHYTNIHTVDNRKTWQIKIKNSDSIVKRLTQIMNIKRKINYQKKKKKKITYVGKFLKQRLFWKSFVVSSKCTSKKYWNLF